MIGFSHHKADKKHHKQQKLDWLFWGYFPLLSLSFEPPLVPFIYLVEEYIERVEKRPWEDIETQVTSKIRLK